MRRRELAGNTTTTDPRSRRIRAGRRGGQITSSSSRPMSIGRPARTCVLPVPRVPDGRTIGRHRGVARHAGTKVSMPGNGQAERMNRTVKEATIKAFHYPDLEALQAHVLAFVTAYSFAKHLKAWRTPFQAI